MLHCDPPFSITAQRIRIPHGGDGSATEFPLAFRANGQDYQVESLEERDDGWTGLTSHPGVTVKVVRHALHLSVELQGEFPSAGDVEYFCGTSVGGSHFHTFIPDIHHGSFPHREKKTFTWSAQGAMRQRLALREEIWMLAPQPHILGIADATGSGICLSIPEPLSSDAVQFKPQQAFWRLVFLHYVPSCTGGRMPRVFIDFGVSTRVEMLDRHLAHARELGLVDPAKKQPEWWHNPLYCTWGDQCRLTNLGLSKNETLKADRILGWADKIRTFYDGEVNFIIDDGYFLGMGDFRIRPELYASWDDFRQLIGELKKRNFRVILWYTPFWVDPNAGVATEHPEWLLHRRDGTLLDETGDWQGKYHFDWTHPALREHQRKLFRHFLVDLDADGFKIDMTYASPPTADIQPYDPSWAAGNLFGQRVAEYIHQEATSLKSDCFLTFNGVECALQPYVSAVRLNDLFEPVSCLSWYRRAELVVRLMPGVAIDVDGWPAGQEKIREYPFVASVYGAPVSYYLEGSDVGNDVFGEQEINRMASVWTVYAHAPIRSGQTVTVDSENERFERRDANGCLMALSLLRRAFAAYGKTIRVTTNVSMPVALPVEKAATVQRVESVSRKGERIGLPFLQDEHRVLFWAEDSGSGILYHEISFS